MPKTLILLWAPFGFRADELAEVVGAQRASITLLYGPRYFAPIRYLALFFRTLFLLAQKRPDVVYAQNPPVFCPLTCLLYCRIVGARLVIDHHSIWSVKTLGGRSPLSRGIGFLERVVSRAASANTAPHSLWARMLVKMGAREVLVYHDYVTSNPSRRDEALRRRMGEGQTLAISSHGGHPLERLEIEAAAVGKAREAGVSLVISGPEEKLERRFAAMSLQPNVRYAGFLERGVYESLKASADFAINITDEPYTLSHVLFEFAASSLPVISSKEPVVEEIFGDSLLYADSTVDDVAEKVEQLCSGPTRAEWAARVRDKQGELTVMHEKEVASLRRLVSG
ncbi:MAG TPA: glycosyltransferase [Nitrososphaerales archaeon]|nr:glycosyltransferase [Nitrososphaerales archaeon]